MLQEKLKKRQGISLVVLIYLLVIAVILLFALTSPINHEFKKYSQEISQTNQNVTFHLKEMSKLNMVWLTIRFESKADLGINLEIVLDLRLYGSKSQNQEYSYIQKLHQKLNISCPLSNEKKIVCSRKNIFYLPILDYQNYKFEANLTNEKMTSYLSEASFCVHTINETMTIIDIALRYFFIVVFIVLLIFFTYRKKKSPPNSLKIEQKSTTILMIGMIFFLGPLHIFFHTSHNIAWKILEVLFESIFITLILIYLLCTTDGLRVKSFNRKRYSIIFLLSETRFKESFFFLELTPLFSSTIWVLSFSFFYLPMQPDTDGDEEKEEGDSLVTTDTSF
ncbi:transmembrane protein [Anaeramoeba flamelloides]|uniref:Transmembrane protein n=1 Tax=Anaeramoeba flamelloides TaxID=1746091 RepID=A0AAV8A9A8_9EUKA|nr:transmembrane protein [Anaeramoeba flamelloides]KAJ6245943.1 transmembrane protein [Anaeramoeba flamelloides]